MQNSTLDLSQNGDVIEYLRWNSYYSPTYNLLYVSTPKVACTSVKWWFAALEGYTRAIKSAKGSSESDPHLTIHDLFWRVAPNVTGLTAEKISDVATSEDVFRFAIVRNPYTRIFSAWQSKLLLQEPLQSVPYKDLSFFNRPLETGNDINNAFEGFLEHLAENEAPTYWDHHWRPQVAVLRPDLIDYATIGKLEKAEALFSTIIARVGMGVPNPFLTRRTNESLIPYQPEFLTPRSVSLIQELYARDFEHFQYELDPPESRHSFSKEQLETAFGAVVALRKRHQRLSERAKEIQDRDLEIAEREKHIVSLSSHAGFLAGEIEAVRGELQQRVDEVAALSAHIPHVLAEKDVEIAGLNEQFTRLAVTKEAELAKLQEALATQREAAAAGQEQLEGLVRDNEALQSQLAAVSTATDAEIAELRTAFAEQSAQNQACRAENAILNEQIEHMRSSLAWRVTSFFQGSENTSAAAGQINKVRRGSMLLRFPKSRKGGAFRADLNAIRKSDLFDRNFYLSSYPDVTASKIDPAVHYLTDGWKEGRDPSTRFSTLGYLAENSDVAAAGLNPLVHYIRFGKKENRELGQSLSHGHSAFSNELAIVLDSNMFDAHFYLEHYPDVAETGIDPLTHYLISGWREGRDPSQHFYTSAYLAENPDVAASGMNPLVHYLQYGREENRRPGRNPVPGDFATRTADLMALLSTDLFDSEFYVSHYPDLADLDFDTATHYLLYGWKEGRDPSAQFGTSSYLAQYPDVDESGMNPLIHYLRFGKEERRLVPGHAAGVRVRRDAVNADAISWQADIIRRSGMFDEGFYVSMYPELGLGPDEAIEHYCAYGWYEGRNPSDEFDSNFYLEKYADIRGMNPFLHYVMAGVNECRLPRRESTAQYEDDIRFGPIMSDIKLLAFYRTPDWDKVTKARPGFRGHAQPIKPHQDLGYYNAYEARMLEEQARAATRHGIYGFCFEMPSAGAKKEERSPLNIMRKNRDIAVNFTIHVRVDATFDLEAVVKRLSGYMSDTRYIRVTGRPVLIADLFDDQTSCAAKLTDLRISMAERSNIQLFIVARTARRTTYGDLEQSLTHVCDGLLDLPLQPYGADRDASVATNRGSIATLPYAIVSQRGVENADSASMSDYPVFPGVTLALDNTGEGADVLLAYTGFDGKAYRRWLDAAVLAARNAHGEDRRFVFLESWNGWNRGTQLEPTNSHGYYLLNETTRALIGRPLPVRMPKVTVVVPNYNHERYLRKRLNSIYQQSYKNIEVLLLDDKSSDRSRDILDEYRGMYPDITRTVYNEVNSKSPFRQWAKGINEASGDLIWIAESDDFCDMDFLSNLIGAFDDESVTLAYGKSVFVDEHQKVGKDVFGEYVSNLECRDQWNGPYTATAHNEVIAALGIKNTIPNASGVLFRKPLNMDLLSDDQWLSMRVAGDWVFYLHVLRGGRIAYRPDAINFFRRYEGSTAETTYSNEAFYREVGVASRTVAALYDVPMEVLERCRDGYRYFYNLKIGEDQEQFEKWYDFQGILDARASRVGNILIPTMGFYPGGAEILPIRLANEFKRQGHSVLVLNIGFYPFESRIRKMLRSDIPVANVTKSKEIKTAIAEYGIEILNTHQWHFQKLPIKHPDIFDELNVHVAALHGMIEHNEAFETTNDEIWAADKNVTKWVYTADKNIFPFKDCGIYDRDPGKFKKLPNGMEPPAVVPVLRSQLGIPDDAFVLCCVSRAIADKGWSECVEAVGRARELSGQDIRLILVGNGPIYDDYAREPAPDYVYPVGFSEDSVGYYATADMGIMLSRFKSESFPLTVVDCLFAGKPYIGTSVGEVPNMLTIDGNVAGAIVKLNDWIIPVEEVARVIAAFASKPELYQAALNTVPDVARRYRVDHVASQYVDLFRAGMQGDKIKARKAEREKSRGRLKVAQ